jgi:hypothetical protein
MRNNDDEPSVGFPAKLTAKQQKALEAILVGASDQQAADSAGVSRNTIMSWRSKLAGFSEALAAARSDLLKRMTARLHAATSLAVRALEEVAKDPRNPSARVAAARVILEFSQRALEMQELEVRMAALEQQILEDKAAAAFQ